MKCVLTKAGDPFQIAHIYPFCMADEHELNGRRSSFWATLRMFWSAERVESWYNAIFHTAARTEVCENLICLGLNPHRYWGKAYFALKPIGLSDDKKRLDLQFFWLSKSDKPYQVDILRRHSFSANLDQGPNLARIINHETLELICSGDNISLETSDPGELPLPNLKLLEMQWVLNRVAAMSAAAEPQNDFRDDDSDDDSDDDRWGWYTMDMEEVSDLDLEGSSSTTPIPSSCSPTPKSSSPIPESPSPIASSSSSITGSSPSIPSSISSIPRPSSPKLPPKKRIFAKLPKRLKLEHMATNRGRESAG